MSPWEKKLLTIFLVTTYRPTELPLRELSRSLKNERRLVREYWEDRIFYTHLMIDEMRQRSNISDMLACGRWLTFFEYLDKSWNLYHPRAHRLLPVSEVFSEFKRQYDLDTNRH